MVYIHAKFSCNVTYLMQGVNPQMAVAMLRNVNNSLIHILYMHASQEYHVAIELENGA